MCCRVAQLLNSAVLELHEQPEESKLHKLCQACTADNEIGMIVAHCIHRGLTSCCVAACDCARGGAAGERVTRRSSAQHPRRGERHRQGAPAIGPHWLELRKHRGRRAAREQCWTELLFLLLLQCCADSNRVL